jgi:lysophospholipase L1-like esterase
MSSSCFPKFFRTAIVLAAICQPAVARPAIAQTKVACIGDSITYGSGLPHRDTQSYPAVLQSLLGNAYEVRNYGVSGTTMLRQGDMPYWNTSAFADSSAWNPRIVVIMLGTNDSKPWNWVYGEQFEGDYLDMIAHYASLPSEPSVYVCTPCPVYGNGNYGISPDVVRDQIVPLVWQIGAERFVPLIDVFTALSGLPQDFPDLVHPNADGAALIADTVFGALMQELWEWFVMPGAG